MLDFLSYLLWRISHRGPGLPVDEAIPYAVPIRGIRGTSPGFFTILKDSQLIPYGRGSEFISRKV